MAKLYKLSNNPNVVRRIEAGRPEISFILGSTSSYYTKYQKWIDEGNTPDQQEDIFLMTINKEMFAADNLDSVQVDITAIKDRLTEVEIEVRGVPVVLPLTNGKASHQIKSTTPETIGLVGSAPTELSTFAWRLYSR